jgi:malonyl-CoA/methylmalonyl-CoA synthetase
MPNVLFDALLGEIANPDKVFLDVPGGNSVTYAQMKTMSARVADALQRLGVVPGDRVAAQVPKSVDAVALYLGVVRAGAVFLPLNTGYTATEVAYFLTDAAPAVFVCAPASESALAPIAASVKARLRTLDAQGEGSWPAELARSAGRFAGVDRVSDDLAAILYTSGTTGRSKGAMLTHGNLLSNAQVLVSYWQFTDRDVLLHALPIFHTHGLFVALNVALISGASVIFMERFQVDEVMRQMPRATSMMGVPTFYSRLLGQSGFTAELAAGMRLFVSGSAPMSAEVHKAFMERTGKSILERYGMTETNMNTSNPYRGDRRPGTVGFPLPGVSLRICDPATGAPLQTGEVGVIEVYGPNVFQGYWQMPEKTATEFRDDGYFITGDLGRIDPDGYVHIVGRDKDLIISGGFNVYPAEVEAAIDAVPGVAESAVVGVPHADFGEGVVAVVAPRPGADLDETRIRDALRGHIAAYKLPKRVLFVSELPRNTMGKIQKNLLREQYGTACEGSP